MPVQDYSVLKGRPVNNRLGTSGKPHYQILVSHDGALHRIAVNVQSADGSEVEFLVRSRFEHPITEKLAALPDGLHAAPARPDGIALDFIRGNLMQPWEFKPLPMSMAGPDNDLNEKLDSYVQRAMSDEDAKIYAFGATWGPPKEQGADKYFGFKPSQGVHDIHMNQGNPPGKYSKDNGPWQDGGLMFEFPRENQWVAVFMKFQSQAWHSEDGSGELIVPVQPGDAPAVNTQVHRDAIPPLNEPDGIVRIIAAYVNDVKTPEHETVTLLNTADVEVDLTGWMIADKQKNKMLVGGSIAAGATRVVDIVAPVTLSNKGGIITLLNQNGVKVHGVFYTRGQAKQPGRTIPFQV